MADGGPCPPVIRHSSPYPHKVRAPASPVMVKRPGETPHSSVGRAACARCAEAVKSAMRGLRAWERLSHTRHHQGGDLRQATRGPARLAITFVITAVLVSPSSASRSSNSTYERMADAVTNVARPCLTMRSRPARICSYTTWRLIRSMAMTSGILYSTCSGAWRASAVGMIGAPCPSGLEWSTTNQDR